MARLLIHVVVFIFSFILSVSNASKCIKKNSCLCEFDEYSQINLENLIPINKFIQDSEDHFNYTITYFFSGCKDADFKNPYSTNITSSLIKCNSTRIVNTSSCESIGTAKEINFAPTGANGNEYQLVYNHSHKNSVLPSITLICVESSLPELKIVNQEVDQLFIYSPDVCLKHLSPHGLSIGSIFCIIFFTSAIVYFLGGGLILYFARGARGVEVVPNYDFWTSIPGLVKDGLIYILSGCRPFTVSTAETYDRI